MYEGKYCIVHTYSAGVFAGTVKQLNGQEAVVENARRIWYWDGAETLSQLAMKGTRKPDKCKFPEPMTEVYLSQVIEVIPCTEAARESIEGVKVWEN
jgi:hypothetical protein